MILVIAAAGILRITTYVLFAIMVFGCSLSSDINKVQAADTMDTIIDILTGLNCETQGVGNLLRSEFAHTCIPAPFFTFAIANLVSPGLYANSVLRLKINDDQMFPSACTRENRVDPNNLSLKFGVCNNIKLADVRIKAISESAVAIAASFLTGEDPWSNIEHAWRNNKAEYHQIIEAQVGDRGDIIDLGVIPWFPWKVVQDNDRLCVATLAFTGWIPVGCKYIKEPYPESIYADFMNSLSASTTKKHQSLLTSCNNMGSCYERAFNASKTSIVITAPIIECIKQMINRLLMNNEVCSLDDIGQVLRSADRKSSSFYQFQSNMYNIVTTLLILYVIFFGFKILLSGNVPDRREMINFILKMLFVTYFSVGINIQNYNDTEGSRLDGMVQWAFPILMNGMQEFASWIMNSSTSGLCVFDAKSDVYPDGLGYLALWDGLDCRVSHYLGLDMIQTMAVENASRKKDFANFDVFNFSIPPYYYLLVPALLSGNMTLLSLALMYPLLVISVAAYLVNATVVCMISIAIVGILAPIFVPMFLFEYTKGYFEWWVKLLLSFMLQPMVVVTFLLTMFSVYDFGFYGTCKYTSKTIDSDGRDAKLFFINNDWGDGSYAIGEMEGCKKSLGYMLNNPLQAVYNLASDTVEGTMKEMKAQNNGDSTSKSPFLNAIIMAPGLLFSSPKLLFKMLEDLVLSLVTACLTLYLIYHASAQISEFAADMTEGVSLQGVTIGAQDIYKAGMSALNQMGSALKNVPNAQGTIRASGAGRGASDKMSTEKGNSAEDRYAEGGKEATDRHSNSTDNSAKNAIKSNSITSVEIEKNKVLERTVSEKEQPPRQEKDTQAKAVIEKGDVLKEPSNLTEVKKDNVSREDKNNESKVEKEPLSLAQEAKLDNAALKDNTLSAPKLNDNNEVMSKMTVVEAKKHTDQAFAQINVDPKNLRGMEYDFARNLAFMSTEKEAKIAGSEYKRELKNILENKLMDGKEKQFTESLSSHFSGQRKEALEQIHKEVFAELATHSKKFKAKVTDKTNSLGGDDEK